MAHAFQSLLSAGYARAALVGSDSPDLPKAYVEQAFRALQTSDVVLAPATDGGYVLIGESCHHPQLFEAMPWSCADLMSQTKRKLSDQNIAWQEISGWEDVDDAASLLRLLQRSPESRTALHIKEQLASLLAQG
jgi:hypothetical protein